MAAQKVHADDTPVPVLAPGTGKTKTGRLWTYVRDDRPAGDETPPAVWFAYSEDRKGDHPRQHLKHFTGALQCYRYSKNPQIRRLKNPQLRSKPGILTGGGLGCCDWRDLWRYRSCITTE